MSTSAPNLSVDRDGRVIVPGGWMWGHHVVQCSDCGRFFWGRKRYERHWLLRHGTTSV